MEPSPELEALIRRRWAAWNARDAEAALSLYSSEPGMLFIGSAPEEWFLGLAAVHGVAKAQNVEFEGLHAAFDVDDVQAFFEGTVGWVGCRLTARLDTTTVPMRHTAVAHLERGVWRFVQSHVSIGVASETSLGPLTTTVEQLAAAVRVERPNLTETSAADGTVTMAFTDIERSTDLAVRLGDRNWFELLRWHSRVVSSCVGHQSGRIVKSLGDGYMLAFASADRALRASIEIQERSQELHNGERVHVRIGVHTGEAVRDADDFFGQTVIVAARITGAAHGEEILVSSLVNDLTCEVDRFDFGDPRTVPLQGLPGEHQLFPLLWRAPSDSH